VNERAGQAAERPATEDRGGPDEEPGGRWSRLYALIVIELAAVIAILYWLTRRFE
jgi:hypothetical protein